MNFGLSYISYPCDLPPDQSLQNLKTLLKVDADLTVNGYLTVSPAYKYIMEIETGVQIPSDLKFFSNYSLKLLDKCERLIVIMFDNWENSELIKAEVKLAERKLMPIHYYNQDGVI